MPLITKRNVSFLLLIWAIILMAGVVWKHGYINKTNAPLLPSPETKKTSFTFDAPTEEEWTEIQEGIQATATNNATITIPLIQNLSVFDCPRESCKQIGSYPAGTELSIDIRTVQDTDEWILVPWPNPQTGPQKKYVSVAELQTSYQEPPPAPQTSIDRETLDLTPAQPISINPKTLVGIVCEFKHQDPLEKPRVTRGSGAIVTEDGHIITARSVVDIAYLNEGMEDYSRTACLVGQMPGEDSLPSIEAIRKINAFVRIPYLSYTADVVYVPPEEGLSNYEKAWLDFALIKINGVNQDARWFGGPTEVPDEFPVAPILISDLPHLGETTLNFAFPSGTTIGWNADIKTLFLQGLISHITDYWTGDNRYADDLFLMESYLDTEDTAGGRFGSPIFWKGYIIGIHTAKQQNSRQIYNVSMKAVLENIFDNQVPIPLHVQ